MGLEVFSRDPADWVRRAREVVCSQAEKARKELVRRRVRLYRDDYREILRWHLWQLCEDPAVAIQLEAFIPLVGGSSFLKRIADELARPLYARDPLRTVERPGDKRAQFDPLTFDPTKPIVLPPPSPEQAKLEALYEEADVNAQMDQVARLLTPSPRVFLLNRVLAAAEPDDQKFAVDVMTADQVSVLVDPRRVTKAAAYIYQVGVDGRGEACEWLLCDDKRFLRFSVKDSQAPIENEFGVCTIVDVARRTATDTYWDTTTGQDLESQTLGSMIIDLVVKRKAWQQSHIQLAFKGDIQGFPKNQTLAGKSIIYIGGGPEAQLFPIDLESDPAPLLKVKESDEGSVAANYGISRDRLNQKGGTGVDDGLQERVAELAQVMYRAERDEFNVAKPVSREHPRHTLQPDGKITIDLGYVHNRTDRKTLLEIRAEEKKQGTRSALDDVLEDNPEYGGDKLRAMRHLQEKSAEQAVVVAQQRALNMAQDANPDQPGQDAAANGALGPAVRDGAISKDKAAAVAKTGDPRARQVALEVLRGTHR